MFLAASGLSLEVIIYIAAAVWGVISWFRGKNAPPQQDESETFRPEPEQGRPRPIQQGESEQERLRRFLEALGVPAGEAPEPPPPPPRPQPQAPPPPVYQPPVYQPPVFQPSPVSRPIPQPRPAFQQPRPAPLLKPQPVFQEPEEMPLAGRLEEPAAAVESISTEFNSMAGGVSLSPMAELQTRQDVVAVDAVTAMDAVTGVIQQQRSAVTSKSVQAMLRSPDSIRTAFVLSEILGPPKSATA